MQPPRPTTTDDRRHPAAPPHAKAGLRGPLAAEDRAPSITEITRRCFPAVDEVLASQLAGRIGRSPPRTAVLTLEQSGVVPAGD
jgi:hypothetical protein